MSSVKVVPGFSLTNRCLLYTSCTLAPAQFLSGIGNDLPINLGFLAYNWYTQIAWYQAIKAKELHALCLLVPHFNLIFAATYLGGISSGNIPFAIFLGFGTAGVITLNNVAAWTSWITNQTDGFGIYQFFFFGWRTLDTHWHTFLLLWQIFDTLEAVLLILLAIVASIRIVTGEISEDQKPSWCLSIPIMITLGAASVLCVIWPLILWTELIMARNHIESDTDWIAVWLFIAQVGALLIPPCSGLWKCLKGNK